MSETIDSAGSAPARVAGADSAETVWDGHGWTGAASPLDLVADELSYAEPSIGDVFVLTPRTRLGSATLTIGVDGGFAVSVPPPDGCNLVEDDAFSLDGSEDTVTRTVEEVVAEIVASGEHDGDVHETDLTYWCQGEPQAFRLDLVPCALPAPSDAHEASGAATSDEAANG